MKSILILCSALSLLAMSTALSFTLQGHNAAIADGLQQAAFLGEEAKTHIPENNGRQFVPIDHVALSGSAVFTEGFTSLGGRLIELFSLPDAQGNSREPVAIFLFGAGLFGVAAFTRRTFTR